MKPIRVVIVGGGFAAVQFAKNLRKKLGPSECEILLFSRENHMVFHPLLADVAGASINADAAAAPLRQMLPGIDCRTERVQRIDLANSEIEFEDGNGAPARMHYDHVVVACGAESNLGIIPGMIEHAFPFKVMRDAIDLRQHIVRQMEQAEASSDPERRRWHLSFIVVGAGFSGVEVAGEINELVRSSTRFYRNFRKDDVVVTLVHSQDQVLPEVAPKLRDFAGKKMRKAGITILLNTRAVAATHDGIEINNGQMLQGATVVCTIGTAVSPLVQRLDVPKDRGRIRTAPEMRIEGHTNAFMWRGVYLFKLPTWSRRIKVALDWSWDVLFPRDLGFLNTDSAQHLTHGYYRPGDFIHRRGEPARVFSVIEEGEVEILQAGEENQEAKVIDILGKGDFFGEGALLGNRPHETSIRARSVVRLVQVGSALFSQIAGTFAPFRELLAKTVSRRSGDLWRRLPGTKSLLEVEPLAALLDPLPSELLRKDATLAEAIKALNESPTGQLLILDEEQHLWGTLDRHDLYYIVARIALSPAETRGNAALRQLDELLPGDPVYVALGDSTLLASTMMVDHGITWLPVVQSKDDTRPVGYLRAEKISNLLIQKLGHADSDHARAAS